MDVLMDRGGEPDWINLFMDILILTSLCLSSGEGMDIVQASAHTCFFYGHFALPHVFRGTFLLQH